MRVQCFVSGLLMLLLTPAALSQDSGMIDYQTWVTHQGGLTKEEIDNPATMTWQRQLDVYGWFRYNREALKENGYMDWVYEHQDVLITPFMFELAADIYREGYPNMAVTYGIMGMTRIEFDRRRCTDKTANAGRTLARYPELKEAAAEVWDSYDDLSLRVGQDDDFAPLNSMPQWLCINGGETYITKIEELEKEDEEKRAAGLEVEERSGTVWLYVDDYAPGVVPEAEWSGIWQGLKADLRKP